MKTADDLLGTLFSSDFSKLSSSFNVKDLPILLNVFPSALQAAFQACFYMTGEDPTFPCFFAFLIFLHAEQKVKSTPVMSIANIIGIKWISGHFKQ